MGSGDGGPSAAGARASPALPASSCARGNRASSPGAVDSVEMCVSMSFAPRIRPALNLTWEVKFRAGLIRGANDIETHISTESTAPGEDARFPRAHEDAGRAGDARAPAAEGPPSPDPMRADRA